VGKSAPCLAAQRRLLFAFKPWGLGHHISLVLALADHNLVCSIELFDINRNEFGEHVTANAQEAMQEIL
jgi:hypothetical protein